MSRCFFFDDVVPYLLVLSLVLVSGELILVLVLVLVMLQLVLTANAVCFIMLRLVYIMS